MTYKQIHGCAMGSPVSPVVANICMEVIENTAFEMTPTKPKTCKRFVDDSFSMIKKTAINSFLYLLNDIEPNISFTIELEQDNKISFLDTLITRQGNDLKIDVFRKPTHTDRYLDFNSHHDLKHKISTARTLIHRAQTLPNTYTGKQDELNHITTTLKCNGYPDRIIKQILRDLTPNTPVPSPEELVGQFFKRFDEKPSGCHLPPCHFAIRKGNNRRTSTYFTETKHQGDDYTVEYTTENVSFPQTSSPT